MLVVNFPVSSPSSPVMSSSSGLARRAPLAHVPVELGDSGSSWGVYRALVFYLCVFLGKKGNIIEKPIPPPEPSEPVLPGSVAVGTVSLAVAKTGALLQGIPLYKYITILNSQKVIQKHTQPPTAGMYIYIWLI